jgi:hypothetical protein
MRGHGERLEIVNEEEKAKEAPEVLERRSLYIHYLSAHATAFSGGAVEFGERLYSRTPSALYEAMAFALALGAYEGKRGCDLRNRHDFDVAFARRTGATT